MIIYFIIIIKEGMGIFECLYKMDYKVDTKCIKV